MNFFPINGEFIIPSNNMMPLSNPNNIENILSKINELDNRIRKLEQRIIRLENENNSNDNNLPDNTMYMI